MTMKTNLRSHSHYLEFKKGVSNKFYEVEVSELEGGEASLKVRYGRIGAVGQAKTYSTYPNFSCASVYADQLVDQKVGKGYKKASTLQALASACEEPEERKNRGLSPLETPIPDWRVIYNAGVTERRLDKWATEFLTKLNLIRASYHDLTYAQVGAQLATLFKQKRAEIKRITGSKTHGFAVQDDPRTISAARMFYEDLRSKTSWPQIYVYWR